MKRKLLRRDYNSLYFEGKISSKFNKIKELEGKDKKKKREKEKFFKTLFVQISFVLRNL